MSANKGDKKKKVVQVETPPETSGSKNEPVWTPTRESKEKAGRFRLFSWILWAAAIALEILTIIWAVPQGADRLWLILVLLIPIGVLAVSGNLLWKKANRLDPASKANPTKFFVQNQLGAIMTTIAFLPLIIFILADKNMDGKQKAVAGGAGAVALILIAAFTGISWDGGPSQEQYAEEENIMVRLTGADEVYWVKNGKVFHVCAEVPDVNKESKDGNIYSGTVAAAHEAGKDRLTKRWESEAVNYCGYTQEQVDAVKAGTSAEQDPQDRDEKELEKVGSGEQSDN